MVGTVKGMLSDLEEAPHNMRRQGTLVVFEGGEGVGKSTQLQRLVQLLDQRSVPHLALREPGGTALGEDIRALLLDPSRSLSPSAEALLFIASRAQIVEERILPALAAGKVVVLDRFFLSTYAYQIYGRGLDALQLIAANQLAVGGLVPDVTLLLDLPISEGMARADARGARDRMEQADEQFHQRVKSAFAMFATAEWQAEHAECGPIERIDASGSFDDVFARIVTTLTQYVPERFTSFVQSI